MVRTSSSNIKSSFNPQFLFDGDDVADTVTWTQVDEGSDGDADLEWYSTDAGNEADISIIGSIDLTSYASPLLSTPLGPVGLLFLRSTFFSFNFSFLSNNQLNMVSWIYIKSYYTMGAR